MVDSVTMLTAAKIGIFGLQLDCEGLALGGFHFHISTTEKSKMDYINLL